MEGRLLTVPEAADLWNWIVDLSEREYVTPAVGEERMRKLAQDGVLDNLGVRVRPGGRVLLIEEDDLLGLIEATCHAALERIRLEREKTHEEEK